MAVQRAPDETVDAGHLESRVGGVAREHVRGDDGISFHQAIISQNELGHLGPREEPERDEGRAETGRDVQCHAVFAVQALGQRRARCASGASRPGRGSTIWPACMWPESTSWKPGAVRSAGKWLRRMRNAAVGSARAMPHGRGAGGARQLDPRAAEVEQPRRVVEQRRRQAAPPSGSSRERIARDGDVVIPEHRVRVQAVSAASS